MNLKLEVGKKYRNRNGDIVEITNFIPNISTSHPFFSVNATYAPDGRHNKFQSGLHKEDLIEEVLEENSKGFLERRREWVEQAEAMGDPEARTRRTGKTTGQALTIIGEILKVPNETLQLRSFEEGESRGINPDHIEWVSTRAEMRHCLIPTIIHLIQDLKLEGIMFNKAKNSFKYDLDGTDEWEKI